MKNIRMEYGIIKVDPPDQEFQENYTKMMLIESMGECVRATQHLFPEKRWFRLCEIFYYLKDGLYGNAWIKINDLRDDLRWKVPGNVYHTLKDICKDMDIKIA
jgi:hypothetical protein